MVAVVVLRLLHRDLRLPEFLPLFLVVFCAPVNCLLEDPDLSADASYPLRHSSSAASHHQLYPNDTVLSRQPRSKSEFVFNFGETAQELLARPLLRDGTSDGCLDGFPCQQLSAECLACQFNYSCVYGEEVTVLCEPRAGVKCANKSPMFERKMVCRYCYQTPSSDHVCEHNSTCQVNSAPRQRYIAQCTVRPNVLCLGRRTFLKNNLCNWTRGYSWWTALLLSIVLGGFGADRFYLGMWQEGIGKLFSFGGLGVWTLVDVVLVAAGYLGPADGSLYIS
uniref:Putative conserved plasma membrane protein n=1 Tax=Ixodes ricinus TaxID=34613 RepID=A0A131Y485_IXORI